VANAPHIPVHLGAMQETVQYQVFVLKQTDNSTCYLINHFTLLCSSSYNFNSNISKIKKLNN